MECEPSMNGRNNQNKLYITVTLPCSHFPFGRGCATEKFAFVPPCISETRIQTLVEDSIQGRGKVFYVGGAVGSQFLHINITPNRNRKSCYTL